jgi:hypothetical protein
MELFPEPLLACRTPIRVQIQGLTLIRIKANNAKLRNRKLGFVDLLLLTYLSNIMSQLCSALRDRSMEICICEPVATTSMLVFISYASLPTLLS